MVEWLSGNRIRGTSTERGTMIPSLPSGSVGGWTELARTTLGSAGDTISVTGLADKRYYMVLTDAIAVGTLYPELELNGDTTSGNYRYRRSINGSTPDTTGGYVALFPTNTPVATGETFFSVSYLSNLQTKEKLGMSEDVISEALSSDNAPSIQEHVSKWTNTSDVINRIDRSEDGSGTYNTNSEVVVLGWDPDDTHTTNFWTELATASGAGSTLDSGTFTAKKYLWVQCYCKPTSSANIRLNFNSDTLGNYAIRESVNGGTWTPNIEQASSDNLTGTSTGGLFFNMFIINVAGQEKLWISHGQENTAGSTTPDRKQMVGKWDNTSDAITKITCHSNFGATSELRVWGSN